MSTSFDVYPAINRDLVFSDLLMLATENLYRFLCSQGIVYKPKILFEVRRKETDELIHADSSANLYASKQEYVWFYVDEIEGGSDAYFWENDKSDFEEIYNAIAILKDSERQEWHDLVLNTIGYGSNWHFNRTVGQPCIVNVMYGILAASLCQLTDGFIFSGDSAWDYERFPASGDSFLMWYFVPDAAIDNEFKVWATECLDQLRGDCHVNRISGIDTV